MGGSTATGPCTTTTTTTTGPAGPAAGPTSAASSAASSTEAGRSTTSPEWEKSPPRRRRRLPLPRAESISDSDQTPFSVIDSLIAQMHTPILLAKVCIHLVPPTTLLTVMVGAL